MSFMEEWDGMPTFEELREDQFRADTMRFLVLLFPEEPLPAYTLHYGASFRAQDTLSLPVKPDAK